MTAAVIKVAVIAVFGTLAALIIKRGSPEMSILLAIAVCGEAVYIIYETLDSALDFVRRARELSGMSEAIFAPVLKCVGIALVAKLASDLCRDGGQGAMAGSVELMGAVGALYAALPLMSTLIDTLERLI